MDSPDPRMSWRFSAPLPWGPSLPPTLVQAIQQNSFINLNNFPDAAAAQSIYRRREAVRPKKVAAIKLSDGRATCTIECYNATCMPLMFQVLKGRRRESGIPLKLINPGKKKLQQLVNLCDGRAPSKRGDCLINLSHGRATCKISSHFVLGMRERVTCKIVCLMRLVRWESVIQNVFLNRANIETQLDLTCGSSL